MSWDKMVKDIQFYDLEGAGDGLMEGTKAMVAELKVTSRTDYAAEVIDDEAFTVMHEQLAENLHRSLYQGIIEQIMEMSNYFEFLYSKVDVNDPKQQEAWMGVMDSILTIKKDMGMQS